MPSKHIEIAQPDPKIDSDAIEIGGVHPCRVRELVVAKDRVAGLRVDLQVRAELERRHRLPQRAITPHAKIVVVCAMRAGPDREVAGEVARSLGEKKCPRGR
jgi:hypothetical protein